MSSPTRSRTLDDPALTAITLQGRRLVAAGHAAELHATAVHSSQTRVVAGITLLATILLTLGLVWPRLTALVDLFALGGLAVDLDGGRSLSRWMWPRRPHRTLLLNPPRPAGPIPEHQVLVVIPDEAGRSAGVRRGLLLPIGLLTLGLPLLLAHPAWERAPEALLLLIGGGLVASAATALWPRRAEDPSVGLAFAERLSDLLDQGRGSGPTDRLHVTVALIGGLDPWYDGLEILLLNHRPRLAPATTMVLVWSPSDGPVHAILDEGLLQRSAAPPLLQRAAELAHLPIEAHRVEATAARRARRLGWRALALAGGRGEHQKAAEAIRAVIDQLRLGLR